MATLAAVGTLAFASSAVAGTTAPVGVVYAGQTTQREVITLETNTARTRVVKLVWGWSADCVLGPAASATTENRTAWTEYRGGYPINAATNRWKRNFTVNTTDAGVARTFTYALRGTRVGTRMKGTIRVTLTDKAIDGQVVRSCDSGSITFSLNERQVYGGLTSQDEPVAATFNVARTQIKRLEWNWSATCTMGPAARPETATSVYWRDVLTGMPFTANRFKRRFSFDPELNATVATAKVFSYNVTLTRIGQTLRGTISAQFVEYDTTGGSTAYTPDKVMRQCASGKVTLVGVKD